MPLTGQCYCGDIKYEVDAGAEGILCGCRTCQILHTDRSYNVGGKLESLKVLSGEPTTYEDTKTDGGHNVKRSFCGKCGTSLWSVPSNPAFAGVVFVKVGALDNAKDIKPTAEIYVNTQLPDIAPEKLAKGGIKRFEGMMAKEVSA